MKLNLRASLFLAILLAVASAPAAATRSDGPKWSTDLDEALARAGKSGNPVLLVFSSSDWCHWCKKLKQEVFDKKAFSDWAKRKVVLCLLDFPAHDPSFTEELRKRNRKVAQKYGINGFPTVLLLESDGGVIARTGYQEGGADKYVENLDRLIEHCRGWRKKFESLDGLKGEARTKAASELFEYSAEVLGKDIEKVASILFTEDLKDSSGHRADAAFILAALEGSLAAEAEKFLASIADKDEKCRYGYLLFSRSKDAFSDFLSALEESKGHELSSAKTVESAKRLLKKLKKAEPFLARNKQLKASLLVRKGLALAAAGSKKDGLAALDEARRLGAPDRFCKGVRGRIESMSK